MAFISYYFHWGEREVEEMDHAARRRWCREISDINQGLDPSRTKRGEKSITEFGKPDIK